MQGRHFEDRPLDARLFNAGVTWPIGAQLRVRRYSRLRVGSRSVRDFAPVTNGLRRTLLPRRSPAGIRSSRAAEIEITVATHFPFSRRISGTESCVPRNRHPLARSDTLGCSIILEHACPLLILMEI